MTISVEGDLTFRDVVRERSGEDIHSCFYCQKCTAGCPTAFVMDYAPAQLLRMIQLGQREAVLSSTAPWLCVGCETCGTRCPNHIRLAPVMDVLRQMALEEGYVADPAAYALHRSFLSSIKRWGRVHELTMLMEYKTRCLLAESSLFFRGLGSDLMMGKDLVLKGKLAFIPERVKRLDEVRKLYAEAGEGNK
ncbi:MAG TPA: heterodisulfide reductase [Anaerolineae bacterium]|nr:heterodisulfide reductase [Anaerolineae bacterium]